MKAKEKTRDERLTKMRSLHDRIKEHPYWMTFDINLLEEVIKDFRELSCCVWNSADDKNPYYVILRCVTHDFNCMLSSIPYWVKEGKFEERKGDTIMVLQTYLMNIHRLVDGMEPDGNIVGYTYLGHDVRKFQAEWDEENGKYFAVNIIKQKNVDAVRKWCKKYANQPNPSHTRDYARQCLEELDRGEMLIGKLWRIVEDCIDEDNAILNFLNTLEVKEVEKPQIKSAVEIWKDMRLEVYAQASGNRHGANVSDLSKSPALH